MKRILTLAALAALTLASCQKNESVVSTDPEGDAVAFSLYSGRAATKAKVTTLDTLKSATDANHQGFGVYAFYQASGDGTAENNKYATNLPANFMSNQKVTWDNSNSAWTYSPVKYWPNNTGDMLSFIAFSPYTNTVTSNSADTETEFSFTAGENAEANAQLSTFTVNNDVLKQEDFLFASSLNNSKPKYDAKTSLTFGHQLARIGFKVAASVDQANPGVTTALATGTTITVEELVVGEDKDNTPVTTPYFYTNGNLTWDKDGATSWIINNGVQSFTLNSTNNFTEDNVLTGDDAKSLKALNKEDSYLMVLPQDFQSAGFPLTIKYKVKTEDSSNSANTSEITNTICQTVKVNFEKGKAYTLNLYLGMTSVKFDVTVNDWTVVDGIEVDVPANITE